MISNMVKLGQEMVDGRWSVVWGSNENTIPDDFDHAVGFNHREGCGCRSRLCH